MLDIAIIGTGPAGLSAAVNGVIRNKKIMLFGNNINDNPLFKAKEINNYIGMIGVSGKELLEKFLQDVKKLNIEIKDNRITEILQSKDCFVMNVDNKFINAKTIIIATGLNKTKKIVGEEKFIGNGVSYCATCDGMLFRNKIVCVVIENKYKIEDIKFLSEICKQVICVINKKRTQSNIVSNKYDNENDLVSFACKNKNINIVYDVIKRISKNTNTNELILHGENSIICKGVFIIREFLSVDNMIFNLKTTKGKIKVNRMCETNIPGVFAAGDCTGWPLQISKATGEGLIAAQSAIKFIDLKQINK
jgi:thioredoxin reductase (NADPH)